MITRDTVDKIIETARIEEVVGEFVNLKRRGVNMLGNCPFHNEKTPSFTVSPVKGIYKCFGCGKAGNSVDFVMEHEHYTFPEALRFLAKKYGIHIEEAIPDPAFVEQQNEKESLYIVSGYAQKLYTDLLHNNDEGKAIGLSYFKERGFNEATIEKFQLGYTLNEWDRLTKSALKEGYKAEYLEKTGLSIKGDKGTYDRFRGRVMFPIHNLSGRVIGFGARILKADPKSPKYLNSPESDIYHKSKVLYGIFFAKKAIVEQDNCYLVEGYTDVISMHQSGVENVVASSGTSLTEDQVRLVSRYTKNITVLYDGDNAGIKASLRGINMILQQGLNVKVVLFPDGDDPDSYSKKVSSEEFKDYIKKAAKDFVLFKVGLLLGDAANDPIKKAALIRDIVETISVIPDAIIRSTYIKECSSLMDIGEQVLLSELNKMRRQSSKKETSDDEYPVDMFAPPTEEQTPEIHAGKDIENQERDIIRLLLNFGDKEIPFTINTVSEVTGQEQKEIVHIALANYVVSEIDHDKDFLFFDNPPCAKIFSIYSEQHAENKIPALSQFTNAEDKEISQLAINLTSFPYELSANWNDMHKVIVPQEEAYLKQAVENSLCWLRIRKVMKSIHDMHQKLSKAEFGEEEVFVMGQIMTLIQAKKELSKELGIVTLK